MAALPPSVDPSINENNAKDIPAKNHTTAAKWTTFGMES